MGECEGFCMIPYRDINDTHVPDLADRGRLIFAKDDSDIHCSGGSFDMVCHYRKHSRLYIGYNKLDRPAITIDDQYPEFCGVHAELDLFRRHKNLDGGTIYIAGKLAKTGTMMPNTQPCIYCATILNEAGVKNAVFYEDGVPVKMPIKELV